VTDSDPARPAEPAERAEADAARGTGARLHVVVPAHDEEARIAACLTALGRAVERVRASRPEVEVTVTVVLDGCTDGTLDVVRAAGQPWLHVLETARVGVGSARALGAAAALARTSRTDATAAPGRQWLAHTDADSRVEPGWLEQQLAALDDGAHLLVGAVVPEPQDLDPAVLARWEAAHPPGATLGHVHGANLGVRADAYRTLGGFDPVPEHEDVRFVERARALGLRVDATTDLPVVTSGRFDGRTPGGYADHLRRTYGDGH
jgi:glycosyltransferase involved in cell wall biosynthesis